MPLHEREELGPKQRTHVDSRHDEPEGNSNLIRKTYPQGIRRSNNLTITIFFNVYCPKGLLSSMLRYTSDCLKKATDCCSGCIYYLGIKTSSPTVSVHESRKTDAGLIRTSNPDITWAVKTFPMY